MRVTQGSLLMLHLPIQHKRRNSGFRITKAPIAMLKRRGRLDARSTFSTRRTATTKGNVSARNGLKTETWMNAAEAVQLRFADEVIQATETIAASVGRSCKHTGIAAVSSAAAPNCKVDGGCVSRLFRPATKRGDDIRSFVPRSSNDFNKQHRKGAKMTTATKSKRGAKPDATQQAVDVIQEAAQQQRALLAGYHAVCVAAARGDELSADAFAIVAALEKTRDEFGHDVKRVQAVGQQQAVAGSDRRSGAGAASVGQRPQNTRRRSAGDSRANCRLANHTREA